MILAGVVMLNISLRVIFEPIVVCCSSMSAGDKQKVKQLAKDLGKLALHTVVTLVVDMACM